MPRTSYRDEAVRVADLALTHSLVEGLTFDNCLILGPGMLFLQANNILEGTTFTVSNVDELVVEANHTTVGAIAFQDCIFRNCSFIRVGFIGAPGLRQNFLNSVAGL